MKKLLPLFCATGFLALSAISCVDEPGTQWVEIAVTVKNVGDRAGKEAVGLYVTDVYGSVSRPVRELKAVEKVALEPGEAKVVTLRVSRRDLSFVGLENRWVFEPGLFRFTVGGLTEELDLE